MTRDEVLKHLEDNPETEIYIQYYAWYIRAICLKDNRKESTLWKQNLRKALLAPLAPGFTNIGKEGGLHILSKEEVILALL